MNSDDLKRRTKEFAHRCVKLAANLPDTYLGNHVRGQLIRCSTSVASNYRATCLAQSKAIFVSKISIVLEESDESYFWLEFIVDEKLLGMKLVQPLLQESSELMAIFASSRKTARKTGPRKKAKPDS
jgi:four helix bundle protein